MDKLHLLGAACILSLVFSIPANAAVVYYDLANHPDSSAAPPPYGLRLDGLLTGGSETYTMDFEHADSSMLLAYDDVANTIRILGTAFGGQDSGGGYVAGTTAVWNIDFTYSNITSNPNGGVNDLKASPPPQSYGSISGTVGIMNYEFFLRDNDGGSGASFIFGDEGGGGHRGFDGLSGWGWLDVAVAGGSCLNPTDTACVYRHTDAMDWIFTGTPSLVPVPAAIWLFGSGLLGLVGMARRMKA